MVALIVFLKYRFSVGSKISFEHEFWFESLLVSNRFKSLSVLAHLLHFKKGFASSCFISGLSLVVKTFGMLRF